MAAILFPVFQSARERARSASCQSNLKQLGLAFLQYTGDYDEQLPHAWDSDLDGSWAGLGSNELGNPGHVGFEIIHTPYGTAPGHAFNAYLPLVWPAKIEPYLKNRQVFSCPSITSSRTSPCRTETPNPAKVVSWGAGQPTVNIHASGAAKWFWGASQVAYGYNTYYLGGGRFGGVSQCFLVAANGDPYLGGIGAKLSQIAEASRTVLLCDNYYSDNASGNAPAFIDFAGLPAQSVDIGGDFECKANQISIDKNDSIPERHSGGLNVAFIDGHVKWMKKADLQYGLASEACASSNAVHTSTDPRLIWNRF